MRLLLRKITQLPDAVEMYVINIHGMRIKGKIVRQSNKKFTLTEDI